MHEQRGLAREILSDSGKEKRLVLVIKSLVKELLQSVQTRTA